MTFFQLLIYNVSCKSQIQLAFISLSLLHPIKVWTAQKCRFSVILRNTVGSGNGADIKHLKVNHKWSNWSALSNCPSAPKHASRTDSHNLQSVMQWQQLICQAQAVADPTALSHDHNDVIMLDTRVALDSQTMIHCSSSCLLLSAVKFTTTLADKSLTQTGD